MGLISRVTNFPVRRTRLILLSLPPIAADEFARLMREGASLSGRDLGMMGEVARDRFGAFTDEEMDALYAFLWDRAMTPDEE